MTRIRSLGVHRPRTETTLPVTTFVVLVVAFLIVPGMYGDQLNAGSFYNAMQGFAPLGLVALAVGLTLIAGEFDISVLGTQALGGVLAVRAGEHSPILGIVVAVAACSLFGFLQGTVIARWRLQSLPVTIGSYIALLGLSNVIASNNTLTYGNIGASVWVDHPILTWFSPRSLIALGAFAIAIGVLGFTRLGLEIKAIGSDRRAGRVSGVPVERRVVALFTISGALPGLAGGLLAYSDASAGLDPGIEPLILGIGAAVLGGVSLSGGRGTAWGLLLGTLAVSLLEELFALTALSASATQVVFGVMLIVIVTSDAPDLRTTFTGLASRRRRMIRVDQT
jgi:ribose/xylose/arabinose/galactoside ABC-type transport system permease subunit